jgi:exodeoxyribonuclease VII small subunit
MTQIDELNFEAAFDELEQTVRRLEAGELTLEESLALLERGQALAAHCQTQLDTAELKVRQLLATPSGESHIAPLEIQD